MLGTRGSEISVRAIVDEGQTYNRGLTRSDSAGQQQAWVVPAPMQFGSWTTVVNFMRRFIGASQISAEK